MSFQLGVQIQENLILNFNIHTNIFSNVTFYFFCLKEILNPIPALYDQVHSSINTAAVLMLSFKDNNFHLCCAIIALIITRGSGSMGNIRFEMVEDSGNLVF